MMYHTSQDDVDFGYLNEFIEDGYTKWALKFSGGTDSTIVLYMLINEVITNNWQDVVEIHCVTGIDHESPYDQEAACQVLSVIGELHDISFVYHDVYIPEAGEFYDPQEYIETLAEQDKIHVLFSGVNAVPLQEEAEELYSKGFMYKEKDMIHRGKREYKRPQLYRKHKTEPIKAVSYPILNIDKRGVAELYDLLNIRDTIFPHTVSCHLNIRHCGECPHCLERQWGFGEDYKPMIQYNFKEYVGYNTFALMPELNDMIASGKIQYDSMEIEYPMVRQICLNSIPGKEDDTDFGRGSLIYDWDKSYFDKEQGKTIVPLRDEPLREEDFTELCTVFRNTRFEKFYNYLTSKFHVGRVRIMKSDPKTCLTWHVDTTPRIHYPLRTQEGCFMVIEDEICHMEEYTWWWADTTKKHTAFNGSREERIHIVAVILGEK